MSKLRIHIRFTNPIHNDMPEDPSILLHVQLSSGSSLTSNLYLNADLE